jgi:hypothetical protein
MHHNKLFLNPRGRSTYGIGICGRCGNKLFLDELFSDPNAPGLMVCVDDLDVLDPYRLPARQTEQINLPFVRPDLNIAVSLAEALQDNELINEPE